MSFDGQTLYQLLPSVYRVRDIEQGGQLQALLTAIAGQTAVLEENLEQLYDDQFIETCADWVVPYIGELVGSHALHGIARIATPSADVADTYGYRRRKGTVPVIEQLARDVTGWNASAVEFFQRLIVTQYMNHIRPQCAAAPDLRRWEALERVGTAFDPIMRTIDVRRIARGRGRYNIRNIGVFLWRLNAYPLSGSPAARLDARRWRFHPLGIDQPLYTHPATEDDISDLATPLNVPQPISRRVLATRLSEYYTGADNIARSVRLYDDSSGSMQPIELAKIRICNLSDSGGSWAHLPPAGVYVIDPVLGRIAVPPGLPAGVRLRADFHYGFSADIGGGEYERAASFETAQAPPLLLRVPDQFATIQAALTALNGAGVVEITDSGRYAETLSLNAGADKRIELRAANTSPNADARRPDDARRRRALRNQALWPFDRWRRSAGSGDREQRVAQARHRALHAGAGLVAVARRRAGVAWASQPYRRRT